MTRRRSRSPCQNSCRLFTMTNLGAKRMEDGTIRRSVQETDGGAHVAAGERHAGEDRAILAARHAVYLRAREQNPARWSGATRNWNPIGPVTLNPERDSVIKTHLAGHNSQVLAA
jgi:hypothetical protein